MLGQWTTPDLTAVIAFLIDNRDALENGELKSARLNALVNWFAHLLRSNTKTRSRKNISAHYDLSNDFFALFLDPTMMYSSAVFATEDEPLEDAQRRKMRLLIEQADIRPEHHVLEIGSGWGGMAIEMARTTGCRVTSVTISREQHALARERVKAAGLDDRVDIQFCDYRDIEGTFDRVVSIEMLEAVGHEHFDSFFRTIDRSLAPGGRAVLQVITIPHARYDAYRKSVDWIRIHIFPGGHLPSVEALEASMHRCSSLRITARDDIGPHYAPTLARWRKTLASRLPDLDRMGYDDVFFRTWEYYFCYCEAAFATHTLGNHHLVLQR
jgi:cyclopropane-fatty-acyl-phospholipid synthase